MSEDATGFYERSHIGTDPEASSLLQGAKQKAAGEQAHQ